MDVKNIKVKIDTKDVTKALKVIRPIREELTTELVFGVFDSSSFDHIFPSNKGSMIGNKLRKQFITNILNIFDTACINHSLKALKARVLLNEGIGHQVN